MKHAPPMSLASFPPQPGFPLPAPGAGPDPGQVPASEPSLATPAPFFPSEPSEAWEPLDLKRVLAHFEASRGYERVADYIGLQADLLPNERVILFFLHAVYDDSLATIRLYARYTVALLNYAEKDVHRVVAGDVDAFIRHHALAGARPATLNTITGALKSFFRHLVNAGALTANPTAFLKKKKRNADRTLPGHLAHSLSEAELRRLFAGMAELKAPLRDLALFKVLFMTGIRAEEAVTLTWADVVAWQGNRYLDILGKGSKARRVYLPDEARQALADYDRSLGRGGGAGNRPGSAARAAQGRPPRDDLLTRPLFASLRRPTAPITRHGLYALVKKWCGRVIGRTDVSPHWFRHSCFTQLAHKGASLESIKALAGHESVETTMRYNEAAQLMRPAGIIFDRDTLDHNLHGEK